jgi:hypothetical protein
MKSFADLFRGREDVYGTYPDVRNVAATDRGKRVARAKTVTEGVSPAIWPELWKGHLSGERRLGVSPILPDSTCWWFCIDVDFYQEVGLYADIADRIKHCGLPLVMTKSKSGGIHLWCFFAKPVLAAKARETAKAFIKKLKLPADHIDIFPAQDKVDAASIGNWVNLPYFGETCPCLGEDGEQTLTLQEFLEYANKRIQHISDLNVKASEKAEARKSGAPPCIDYAKEHGVPDGYRNNFMMHYAVYAMKANPDNVREDLDDFNDGLDDPLPREEMRPIIKSATSGKYKGYLCKKVEGLFCDKRECRMREFGIGGGNMDDLIDIEKIEKIDGEEPVYRVTIDGKRFQLTLEQMFTYVNFRRVAFGALDRYLPNFKQPEWEDFMKDRIAAMDIQEAASDTQSKDRVVKIFERFCEGTTAESLKIAVERGLPYFDGKNIIFRGDEFMMQVDRQLNKLPRNQTWAIMRDHGCVMIEHMIENVKMPFWCWVADGRPLWFNPDKGEQV